MEAEEGRGKEKADEIAVGKDTKHTWEAEFVKQT